MAISSASESPLSPPNEATPAAGTVLTGVPVVPGIAYAPVIRPGRHPVLEFVAKAIEVAEADRDAELARFSAAAAAVADRLRERAAHATGSASEVLAATAQLAQDRAWLGESEKWIKMGTPAVRAAAEAVEQFADMFTKTGRADGRTRDRSAGHARPRHRRTERPPEPGVPVPDVPSILLAEDLAPGDTAGLDPALVIGAGHLTRRPHQPHRDHRAAVGIPCVVATAGLDDVAAGTLVLVDGARGHGGRVTRTPPRPRRRSRPARRPRPQRRAGPVPAPRRTGTPVAILANVQDGAAARVGRAETPAEGVGLFRTELCFLNRDTEPTVDEQAADLRRGARRVPRPQGGDPHPGCRLGQAAEVRRASRGGQPGARRARHPHRRRATRGCWSASWTRSPPRPSRPATRRG